MKTYGRYSSQYITGALQKDSYIGQGYNLTDVGGATKGYIQSQLGFRHHFDELPYWKVTSAPGGTWSGLYLF